VTTVDDDVDTGHQKPIPNESNVTTTSFTKK
jgi:hypothetical protein